MPKDDVTQFISGESLCHQTAQKPLWPTVTWISLLKRYQHIRPLSESRYAPHTRLQARACLPATLSFARIQLVHFVFVDVMQSSIDGRVRNRLKQRPVTAGRPEHLAHSGSRDRRWNFSQVPPSLSQKLVLEQSEETD